MSGELDPITYFIGAFGGTDTVYFNSRTPDASGVLAMLEEPPGWAGPDVRRSEIYLALRDGARRVSGYYGTRDMTLNGQLYAASRDSVRTTWEKLMRVCDRIREDAVVFTAAETEPKIVDCQLNGSILRNWEVDLPLLNFSIPMVATDPLKYEAAQSTETLVPGTAETLTNAGDKDTWPTIVINANGGTTITDVGVSNLTTGKEVRFSGMSITSGNLLVADMRRLQRGESSAAVLIGSSEAVGVNRISSWVAPREALYLAPGANSIRLNVYAGTNSAHRLEVRWRGAWL